MATLVRVQMVLLIILALTGCTTVLSRSPVPEQSIGRARPYGIQTANLRFWGDELGQHEVQAILRERISILRSAYRDRIRSAEKFHHYSLALSGGGSDGAFGAGLLAGWTRRGDRPRFNLVTGVSTGAIIAVFAFLGPRYDDTLRWVYTENKSSDVFRRTFFAALTGGTAVLDTSPYRAQIEHYINDDVVAEIAQAYRRGRVLLIGTTNIDAARPVIWNIGAIANSGSPYAKRLIHDVIQASSAIPAAFPPVIIPVHVDGRRYDEMHVDGGAVHQVILYSPELHTRKVERSLGVTIDRTLYVVINNKLEKPYNPVRPRVLAIAGRAASSLIGGSGGGDIYRIYAITQRDNIELNVMAIPRDFDVKSKGMFDPAYMRALYDLGYRMGFQGRDWTPYPPGFEPGETGKDRRATTPQRPEAAGLLQRDAGPRQVRSGAGH